MSERLHLRPGAPRLLPAGDTPWRVIEGSVEVYLVTPMRRRLIAVIGEYDCIIPIPRQGEVAAQLTEGADGGALLLDLRRPPPPTPSAPQCEVAHAPGMGLNCRGQFNLAPPGGGGYELSIVAAEDAVLEADRDADTASWRAAVARTVGTDPASDDLLGALDAHFASTDASRDAARSDRLAIRSAADVGGTAGAIAAAAALFGRELPRLSASADFHLAPALARIAGLRAAKITLAPGWWRDDAGPPAAGGLTCGKRSTSSASSRTAT